ncbi:acyltransferase [Deefgea tanakiae]|uniref:Acyltransferase n=1 Tax=Deefgea tanakiae TaxID=2865840 RepID=A0ABX8ZBK4_9NEIS|nr:acyltransferase [Deefgea tanakiae]QZA78244.1 acyltransferase [Deefgea tanakiae]
MRDDRIDILRFIGLAMIIFAHVGSTGVLFELRNFDVPLMVLVSGMAFGLSFKENESYWAYIWKRIKRLVFPVWIFLTIYFFALFVIYPTSDDLNIRTVLSSYALLNGIGYVWIIRVFLLVAIAAPFLFIFHNKVQADGRYFLALMSFLFLYEILRYLSFPYVQEGFGKIVSYIILYVVPYSIIFSVGLRMLKMNKSQLLKLAFASFSVFIAFGFFLFFQTGRVFSIQELKYPPSIYFFSYSLFVSTLLWAYSEKISSIVGSLKISKITMFVANNSIWIYLWHIPLVKFVDANVLTKYLIVFAVATTITYVQVYTVTNLLLKYIESNRARKNIKILLTG